MKSLPRLVLFLSIAVAPWLAIGCSEKPAAPEEKPAEAPPAATAEPEPAPAK